MPFEKAGDDDYVGPSGKHFTLAQVRLYYANGGTFEAGDAEADLAAPDTHPHRNLGPFLHPKGASMPLTDAYSTRHAAQRLALDDDNGARGPVPQSAAGIPGETPESQVPGIIDPSYETAGGSIVMQSRCLSCGASLSARDLESGKGTHCGECAAKMVEVPGAGPGI